jgi:hypothetical protein
MRPRPDLFTQIHKGIRSMLYDASARLQAADFTDRSAAVLTPMEPSRYAEWLRRMLPSLNDLELIGLLRGLKAGSPPEVVANVAGIAGKSLPPERWSGIRRAADI